MTYLIDHILKLSLSGVLSQRSHNGTKLLSSDSSITIYIHQHISNDHWKSRLTFIKEGECLFKFWLLANHPYTTAPSSIQCRRAGLHVLIARLSLVSPLTLARAHLIRFWSRWKMDRYSPAICSIEVSYEPYCLLGQLYKRTFSLYCQHPLYASLRRRTRMTL
jgi:hypothetical protein